jgi:hypothetical protein
MSSKSKRKKKNTSICLSNQELRECGIRLVPVDISINRNTATKEGSITITNIRGTI